MDCTGKLFPLLKMFIGVLLMAVAIFVLPNIENWIDADNVVEAEQEPVVEAVQVDQVALPPQDVSLPELPDKEIIGQHHQLMNDYNTMNGWTKESFDLYSKMTGHPPMPYFAKAFGWEHTHDVEQLLKIDFSDPTSYNQASIDQIVEEQLNKIREFEGQNNIPKANHYDPRDPEKHIPKRSMNFGPGLQLAQPAEEVAPPAEDAPKEVDPDLSVKVQTGVLMGVSGVTAFGIGWSAAKNIKSSPKFAWFILILTIAAFLTALAFGVAGLVHENKSMFFLQYTQYAMMAVFFTMGLCLIGDGCISLTKDADEACEDSSSSVPDEELREFAKQQTIIPDIEISSTKSLTDSSSSPSYDEKTIEKLDQEISNMKTKVEESRQIRTKINKDLAAAQKRADFFLNHHGLDQLNVAERYEAARNEVLARKRAGRNIQSTIKNLKDAIKDAKDRRNRMEQKKIKHSSPSASGVAKTNKKEILRQHTPIAPERFYAVKSQPSACTTYQDNVKRAKKRGRMEENLALANQRLKDRSRRATKQYNKKRQKQLDAERHMAIVHEDHTLKMSPEQVLEFRKEFFKDQGQVFDEKKQQRRRSVRGGQHRPSVTSQRLLPPSGSSQGTQRSWSYVPQIRRRLYNMMPVNASMTA